MEKLEIEKTKPTFIISVLKVEHYVVLVSSIFNFFVNTITLANQWRRKIILSCSNSALSVLSYVYIAVLHMSNTIGEKISKIWFSSNKPALPLHTGACYNLLGYTLCANQQSILKNGFLWLIFHRYRVNSKRSGVPSYLGG